MAAQAVVCTFAWMAVIGSESIAGIALQEARRKQHPCTGSGAGAPSYMAPSIPLPSLSQEPTSQRSLSTQCQYNTVQRARLELQVLLRGDVRLDPVLHGFQVHAHLCGQLLLPPAE